MPQSLSPAEDPTVTVVQSNTLAQKEPLVSVCVVTYNQEQYIGEALDSVLRQETDFDYEIIVGDDCSTDETRAILEGYQREHPERIRLHLHEEHYEGVPAKKNMVTNLEAARGRYVALLDGDDYWISRDKLQRKAALLEARPEAALTFHDARRVREAGQPAERISERVLGRGPLENRVVHIDELIPPNKRPVPAPSVMYRRALFDPVPLWFWNVLSADWAMQLHLAQRGEVYYHHDLLAAWRERSDNITAQRHGALAPLMLREIPIFTEIYPPFRFVATRRRATLYGGIAGMHRREMYRHIAEKQYAHALQRLWRGGIALLHHLFYRYRPF